MWAKMSHAGIVNSDEAQALSFYRDFLRLDKTREFIVEAELSQQLFSVSWEIRVLVFEKEGLKIEVFISPGFIQSPQSLFHVGLTVDDLEKFIAQAHGKGIDVIIGKHKEKTVYFVKDFAGNMIEVKQG